MPQGDYYAVLGIDRRAGAEEIKKAHRRLTLQWHPDRHPDDPEVAERYRTINAAYNTLSDPVARARYEADLRHAAGLELSQRFEGQSARDLLQGVFGDVFGTKKRQRRRGRDLRYTLTVDLADAVLGSTHTIAFDAPGPCRVCSGTGTRPGGQAPRRCPLCDGRGEVKGDGLLSRRTPCGRCDGTGLLQADPCQTCRGRATTRDKREFVVQLPPATEAGAERILSGQGEPGRFGAAAGDLRVKVNVRAHPWLSREGATIRCVLPISVTEAALGTRVDVPTVDGVVAVDVPAGIASGTRLRLRGKGVPPQRGHNGARGDQLVSVRVVTPQGAAADPALVDALRRLERASADAKVLPDRARQRADLAAYAAQARAGGKDDGSDPDADPPAGSRSVG